MTRTKNDNRKTREAKAPDFLAWHVAEREDAKAFWTRIGAAWLHDDGNGQSLQLDLMPVGGGRIVLRAPKAEDQGCSAGSDASQ